ncbi:UDP-N-acetylmuramoyl-L-alanyl-D-glutamate--2,6-diaminopimelate ligase [Saccharicrinis sp. FJH54]|uniref:UDP-N-acetylmuramoyl-L-alanyl-D-glutamate--2, 6-diaminopimelate ligase n=1 Tax=Saccharicrinis sp. FJH54 TaxID=3344665 RepID=UPI0035D44039
MKKLLDILPEIEPLEIVGNKDVIFGSIEFDSRKVGEGDLFVAMRGTQTDGHVYIPQVIEKQAGIIVCEVLPEEMPAHVTFIRVSSASKTLGRLVAAYFDHPSQQMTLVGVTGTNGKTSIATLLYNLFQAFGYKAGLLSTVANYVDDTKIEATHTTPDAITINRLLHEMVEAKCEYCFMEVSSHAIDQDRIEALDFDGAIFTNLTRDHLDYHETFAAYRDAKKKFFDGLKPGAFALYNADDKNGTVMVQNCKADIRSYSSKGMADFKVKIIERHFDGMQLSMDGHDVWVSFTGDFNAMNLLSVYSAAVLLDEEPSEVLVEMSKLKPVAGRFETLKSNDDVAAIVDYAHTPDALINVLDSINVIRRGEGNLITVVGAGGNRDKGKRPLMAEASVVRSEKVILTSDNPRFEEPDAIIDDMYAGIPEDAKGKVLKITNREQAIHTAIMLAGPGDVILVAGKGHETYQDVKGVKSHFDDKEIVEKYFKQRT